ncbi:MAG: ABC transporter permease [Candidatus Heimdallarchaeota archaeon]|nr:ABC transporter permease [Candidatus Heimdallarchaeota archaeon]
MNSRLRNVIELLNVDNFSSGLQDSWRSKRRIFSLFIGIILFSALFSGILLYNKELSTYTYEAFVGDFPFEVAFDCMGDESLETMQAISTELQSDSRVVSTTVIGSSLANQDTAELKARIFSEEALSMIEPKGRSAVPFFVEDNFFDTFMGDALSSRNFQGEANIADNNVIISEKIARKTGLNIGSSIPLVVFAQLVPGSIDAYHASMISNLTIAGTYDSMKKSNPAISGHPFQQEAIILNLKLLETAELDSINQSMHTYGNFFVATKLIIDNFNIGDPEQFNLEIEQFINQMTKKSSFDIIGHNTIEETIIFYKQISLFVTLLYFLLSIPVIILSVHFLIFGLEINLEERKKSIAIKKVQGADGNQIFAELRNEVSTFLIFGSVIGYFFGDFFAWLLSSASGFMKVQQVYFADLGNEFYFDPIVYVETLLVISILSFVLVYRNGKKYIDLMIVAGLSNQENKNEGYRERFKIDIWIFFISLIGFVVLIINEFQFPLIGDFTPFEKGLIFSLTPFFFWVGGSSVGLRLVNRATQALKGNYYELSIFKDIKKILISSWRKRGDINRLIFIIIFTLSITSMSIIQGNTEEFVNTRELEWEVGADWKIDFSTADNYSSDLLQIEGFDRLIKSDNLVVNALSSNIKVVCYQIDKILENIEEGTPVIKWQEDNFIKETAIEALSKIQENPLGVYISQKQLFSLDTKVGGTIDLRIDKFDGNATTIARIENIKVLGLVNQLPGNHFNTMLVSEMLFHQILALQHGYELDKFENTPLNGTQYFVRTTSGQEISNDEITHIRENLLNNSKIFKETSLYEELDRITSMKSGFGIAGLLSFSFIISVVALLVSTFNYTASMVDKRNREFQILRAIGARTSQLYKLVMAELFIIFFLSSVIGLIIGIGHSYLVNEIFLFTNYFIGESIQIKRRLVFPIGNLLTVLFLLFVNIFISMYLSIKRTLKKDLTNFHN